MHMHERHEDNCLGVSSGLSVMQAGPYFCCCAENSRLASLSESLCETLLSPSPNLSGEYWDGGACCWTQLFTWIPGIKWIQSGLCNKHFCLCIAISPTYSGLFSILLFHLLRCSLKCSKILGGIPERSEMPAYLTKIREQAFLVFAFYISTLQTVWFVFPPKSIYMTKIIKRKIRYDSKAPAPCHKCIVNIHCCKCS